MPLICVTLAEEDLDSAVELANTLECDIIEVRVDHLKDASELSKLADIRNSLMVTCMPE